MSAISDPITKLPDPPLAGDLDFDDKADAFLPALVIFSEELEVFRQAINSASGQLAAYVGTYVDGTTFTIPIDATSWAMVGGRIKADCGGNGIKYATITSITALNSVTTIVVSGDVLMNPISSIRFFNMEVNTTPNHKSIHATGNRDAIVPTDIGAAPESHATNTNKYGQATEENFGHVQLGTALPSDLGTASKGSGTRAAKEDHIHPTTGLMTNSHPANIITGFGTEPPSVISGTSGTPGSADTVARSDHSHDLGQHTHVDAATGGNLLSSVEPPAVDSSNSGKVGTATKMARADHSHDLGSHTHVDATTGGSLLATTEPGEVKGSTSGKVGTGTLLARADHSHDLGTHNHSDDTTGGTIDHGSLTGRGDDDHTQYLLVDGTRALTGPLSCPSAPIDGNSLANKTYVDGILAAQDAMIFKGALDCSGSPSYPAADRGHTYKVSVAGKIGGSNGIVVYVNDTLICTNDNTVSGIQENVGSNWVVIHGTIDTATLITKNIGTTKGDVIGFSGDSTPVRVPVGVDGHVMTVDSTSSSGIAWKEATGGFKQVFVAANYTANTLDLVEVNSTLGAFVITLPASGMVEVYDAGGNAGTNNITVKDAGGTGICLIDVAYGDVLFRYNTITSTWDIQNLTEGAVDIPVAGNATAIVGQDSSSLITPSALLAVVTANPTYYERDVCWKAKPVIVAADRYTILSPNMIRVNIAGLSGFISNTQVAIDLSAASNWDNIAYATAANRAGKDFYIYECNNAGVLKHTLSANVDYPTGYTSSTSRKVGGFHCLCVFVGTISGHALSGYLAGDILPASVWDLKHRPVCDSEGMVYVDGLGKWVDIYLSSVSGGKLVSAYNATCADGTSSPAFHWYKFSQWLGQIGKRMLTQTEFVAASLGSNQGTNIAGSADPGTTGGKSDTAGRRMISNVGCEDCCGNLWQWGEEAGGGESSAAWVNAYDGNDAGVAGQHYQAPNRAILGGDWYNGAFCGSRGSSWSNGPLALYSSYGARGVAEPLAI